MTIAVPCSEQCCDVSHCRTSGNNADVGYELSAFHGSSASSIMAGIAKRSAMCTGKLFFIRHLCAFCIALMLYLPGCSSPPLEVCGGSFNGSGTIATPNFPYTYPANIRCIWNLTAMNGNVIVIQFVTVAIDLTKDLLLIYNGSTPPIPLRGSRPPFNLTLCPRVTLEFTSDDSVGNLGFQLHWMTDISCQIGVEYFNGHTCMPCTGPDNYLSRNVRNCSRHKDAEYADLSPVEQDNETVPSSTALPKEDYAEKTVLWEWLGPVIFCVVIIPIVSCVCKTRCKKSNEQSSPSR